MTRQAGNGCEISPSACADYKYCALARLPPDDRATITITAGVRLPPDDRATILTITAHSRACPQTVGLPSDDKATIAHTAKGPCIIVLYYHIIKRDTLKVSRATWPTGTPATSWSGARGRGRRQLELHTWMGGAGVHPET